MVIIRSCDNLYLNANLLVDTLLLFLDLLLKLLQRSGVRSSSICFEHLNIPRIVVKKVRQGSNRMYLLVGKWCNLLLRYLIVCKVLLVLLPIRSRSTGHLDGCRKGVGAD